MSKEKVQRIEKALLNPGNIEFYTVESLAELLNLKDTTIRKYYREGKIKGHRFAGRIYFFKEDIIQAIKAGE